MVLFPSRKQPPPSLEFRAIISLSKSFFSPSNPAHPTSLHCSRHDPETNLSSPSPPLPPVVNRSPRAYCDDQHHLRAAFANSSSECPPSDLEAPPSVPIQQPTPSPPPLLRRQQHLPSSLPRPDRTPCSTLIPQCASIIKPNPSTTLLPEPCLSPPAVAPSSLQPSDVEQPPSSLAAAVCCSPPPQRHQWVLESRVPPIAAFAPPVSPPVHPTSTPVQADPPLTAAALSP